MKTKRGLWQMRIRLADGTRIRSRPFPPGTSEAYAREKAAYWAEQHRGKTSADLGRTPSPRPAQPKELPKHEDRSGWWDRYFAYRAELKYYGTKGTYLKHIASVVGAKDPRSITQEDSRKLRRYLDDRDACGISPKTAENVWGIWTTACKAACGLWSKDKDGLRFKVRSDNPCAGVLPPDKDSDPKQLQFLYPDEFLALVSCTPSASRVAPGLRANRLPRDSRWGAAGT